MRDSDTSPFFMKDYLDDPELAFQYLQAAFADNDHEVIATALDHIAAIDDFEPSEDDWRLEDMCKLFSGKGWSLSVEPR